MLKVHLARIKGLIDQAIDLRRLELGRKRQDLICRGESPDYSPLILGHCKHFLGDCKDNRVFLMGEHFLAGGKQAWEMTKAEFDIVISQETASLAEKTVNPKFMDPPHEPGDPSIDP